MRNPITDFYFKTTPVGDYRVQVDFSWGGSLRRGSIGEIYSVGRGTGKRWVGVLADGGEIPEVYKTRKLAAEALLELAPAIFVNGHPLFLFTATGIEQIRTQIGG
jgi:hypothetical protein